MLKKIAKWYKDQSETTQVMIWLGVILIIGIIIRWDYISDSVARGFDFFKTK